MWISRLLHSKAAKPDGGIKDGEVFKAISKSPTLIRSNVHETVSTMRPGPAVVESLCQPSPPAHRLVSTNHKNAPTFLQCYSVQR